MFHHKHLPKLGLGLLSVFVAQATFALDGSNNVFVVAEESGWKTFEILSGGDTLGDLAKEDFVWTPSHDDWDGLGAYRHDNDTLRVFINHEAGAYSTFSRVDLDVSQLKNWITAGKANNTASDQVLPASAVVKAVSKGWTSVDTGAAAINNPCTSNVWLADTFGEGLGFADGVFLTSEETFDSFGTFWFLDLANRALHQAADVGLASWENATPVNTGRTDTIALLLSEDAGSNETGNAPLRLYIGQKNPSGNFLERNGLVGGTLYYWNPEGDSTNGTLSGLFTGGNGTVVSGTWSTDATGAALFSKSEDVHVNMNRDSAGFGVEVALASQAEGVFIIDFADLDFVAGGLGSNQTSEVTLLYTAGTQVGTNTFDGMDNLVWSPDGCIYVNEDDGEGDIWRIDTESLLASYATSDFTPDAAQVLNIIDANIVSESSGIIDISSALDYQPGSIFLTSGQSSTLENNQLALLVAPTAATLESSYTTWLENYPALDTVAKQLKTADPDLDTASNLTEFALGRAPDTYNGAPLIQLDGDNATISLKPAQSLNIFDYVIEYTNDLTLGFNDSILVSFHDIAPTGLATLQLPEVERLFVRLQIDSDL